MSKHSPLGNHQATSSIHAAEYSIIKHDLIRVVILNLLYLAGVLVLYYFNQQSHFLEKLF